MKTWAELKRAYQQKTIDAGEYMGWYQVLNKRNNFNPKDVKPDDMPSFADAYRRLGFHSEVSMKAMQALVDKRSTDKYTTVAEFLTYLKKCDSLQDLPKVQGTLNMYIEFEKNHSYASFEGNEFRREFIAHCEELKQKYDSVLDDPPWTSQEKELESSGAVYNAQLSALLDRLAEFCWLQVGQIAGTVVMQY